MDYTEHELWELDRLHKSALELQAILAEVESAAPERIGAVDPRGAVHMVLDRTMLPESIEIAADWKRRINASEVGGAVLDAYAAGVRRRSDKWKAALEDSGFRTRFERLESSYERTEQSPLDKNHGQLPPAFRPNVGHLAARPLDVIAEDFLSLSSIIGTAMHGLGEKEEVVEQGIGSTRVRSVTIVLTTEGLSNCEVNARWAASQSGLQLTAAVREALVAARNNLYEAVERRAMQFPSNAVNRLREIFDEALAASFNNHR